MKKPLNKEREITTSGVFDKHIKTFMKNNEQKNIDIKKTKISKVHNNCNDNKMKEETKLLTCDKESELKAIFNKCQGNYKEINRQRNNGKLKLSNDYRTISNEMLPNQKLISCCDIEKIRKNRLMLEHVIVNFDVIIDVKITQ